MTMKLKDDDLVETWEAATQAYLNTKAECLTLMLDRFTETAKDKIDELKAKGSYTKVIETYYNDALRRKKFFLEKKDIFFLKAALEEILICLFRLKVITKEQQVKFVICLDIDSEGLIRDC